MPHSWTYVRRISRCYWLNNCCNVVGRPAQCGGCLGSVQWRYRREPAMCCELWRGAVNGQNGLQSGILVEIGIHVGSKSTLHWRLRGVVATLCLLRGCRWRTHVLACSSTTDSFVTGLDIIHMLSIIHKLLKMILNLCQVSLEECLPVQCTNHGLCFCAHMVRDRLPVIAIVR